MSLYARRPGHAVPQLVGDILTLVWVGVWWLASRFVDGTIRALAEPARATRAITTDLARQTGDAASQVAGVPVVGSSLRQPFDGIAAGLTDLSASASDQVVQVERVATVMGWLAFLIPVLVVLAWWVPKRVGFVRRSGELSRLAASPEGTQLLALRALTNQPLGSLRRIDPDPVAAWRAGDSRVVDELAALELHAAGVTRKRSR
ncbi:MAG: hypothetical protein Q4F65_09890 [Propionibacteriaceae bacterium]|nr:hypothetical protein [Propionibacteriaceae bacterium]